MPEPLIKLRWLWCSKALEKGIGFKHSFNVREKDLPVYSEVLEEICEDCKHRLMRGLAGWEISIEPSYYYASYRIRKPAFCVWYKKQFTPRYEKTLGGGLKKTKWITNNPKRNIV